MKRTALLLFVLVWLPSQARSSAGDSSLPLLSSSMDPAVSGQANALIAGADDISSMAVNPAGLAHLTWQGLGVSYNTWFFDLKHNNLMLASPVYFGSLGISIGYLYTAPIDEISEWNTLSSKLKYSILTAGLSYGSDFSLFKGTLAAGLTAKYIYEQLGLVNGNAFLFDLGLGL